MAIGKITGQMLGDSLGNLDRDGVDLAFDTDLIYLDVTNRRVGIKTNSPAYELDVNGTTRSTNLEVTTTANIADITIQNNNIISNTGILNLAPTVGSQVVYQNKLIVDDIQIEGNLIKTINSNANLDLSANGTGTINLNANVEVFGNLHATGTITADGNVTLGDANTDNVVFNADIASDIIPDVDNLYKLGSSSKRWNDLWVGNISATTVTTTGFSVDGIDIALQQGNIIYVALNGDDGNTGLHQQDPLASVGRALDLATPGDTVYIYPGTYSETLPLTIPAGVSVKGIGIRSVIIQPDSDDTVDIFLMNGETTVEDLTITGFKFDSATNTGYGFRFAPNMTVTSRSPYVRNVTVITQGSVTSGTDPRGFDTHDAGKGAYLDGSIVNAASKEASMLFHSVTFICPGVDNITATNGVRIEWLNCFTYFADRGFYALSSSSGFAGDGKTRVKITNKTGTFNVGNTLSYYDVDGITVLASGVIESIDGDFYVIDGRVLGFERLADRNPKTIFANGNAALSTAQKKFGTASLYLDGAGDFITVLSQADFAFGTGDYTLEFFVRPDALGTLQVIYDARTAATDLAIYLEINAAGNVRFFFNGGYRITSSVAVTAAVWNHVVLARESGTTRLFVNGTLTPTTYADANNYPARSVRIGNSYTGGSGFAGYIDDLRICKGAAKYTASYVVPTSALTGDNSTVLLAHFDGPNGSTSFLDDGVTLQDVRTSAGGTASIIDFADYSDFGAEIRSIASASVYGNYGVYGDGPGVVGYFIGHNFGYVGSGKFSNNDPSYYPEDSTNVNEVVEINNAQIYYTSVDHKGDFRVGEFFYVNQRDGTVIFDESDFTITSSTGVTFTDGSAVTEITPTYIQTGNIKISGNTIESIVNDITLTAANNEITATSNVTVTGTLTIQDNVTVNGNTTIGNTSSDTVTFNSRVASNFVPSSNAIYNLGSVSNQWNNVYLSEANIDDIQIKGNLIKTTVSNSNLELRANGSGVIRIDQLDFNDNTIVSNTTNTDIQINPNGTGKIQLQKDTDITGNLSVSGNITLGGNIQIGDQGSDTINLVGSITNNLIPAVTSSYDIGTNTLRWRNLYISKAVIDEIEIDTNVIKTTVSNADLELRGNGTGYVKIDQLSFKDNDIISNTTDTDIRINPNGSGTIQLEKDTTVTGNLTVTGTSNFTGNVIFGNETSDTVTFNGRVISDINPATNSVYQLGSTNLRWANVYLNRAVVDDIVIDTNVIQSTLSNQNLELRANGTGSIQIDQLNFKNNSIVSNTTNTDIQINPNGTGTIQLQKDTYITGNLDVTGNITLGGNITIGDQDSDTINLVGSITNNLIPSVTAAYDIGKDNLRWRNIYGSKLIIDDIEIDTNLIRTTVSNSDLELRGSGTGAVRIDDLDFNANVISTNSVNTDIEIDPNGTGTIQLQKDTSVTGDFTVSGTATYLGNTVFGDSSADNVSFNARVATDIIPSTNSVYNLGSSSLRWNNVHASRVLVDNIEIDTNVIQSTESNANLELRANGTGSIQIDQLNFKNNTIVSNTTNTDIQINPNGTGKVQLLKDTEITGNLDVSGNITLGGNIQIGNQTTDTINVIGSITNNLIPNVTGAFDLGSPSLAWRNLYASNLQINDIEINDNYIRTISSNADLELSANGTGVVRVTTSNLNVDQNLSVAGTSNLANTNIAGTITVTNLTVNNTITASTFATGDIEIQGNVIRTINSNSNLELRANGTGAVYAENLSFQQSTISGLVAGQDIEITPSGTGIVKINSDQSLMLPAGTDAQRPVAPSAGMIRYNSTINQYEGYNGTYWIQLGGVIDVDRNTYVIPELSPGSNENIIYFVTNGTVAATLDATQFSPNKIVVDDLEINGNVIKTTTTNTNLELRPNGTGAVVVDGFRFTTNQLLNTNSGAVTEFRSTGTGYYKIVGTNAVVIPAGGTGDRPGAPQAGMIRLNTGLGFVEVYDGTTWGNIAGASSGITFAQAEDIGLASALIFG